MNVYKKQTRRHRKQIMVMKGEKGGDEINQAFGINRYTVLYIKQITNKDLWFSTGNYTQYFVTIYKRKESGKQCVCIYTHTYILTHIYNMNMYN